MLSISNCCLTKPVRDYVVVCLCVESGSVSVLSLVLSFVISLIFVISYCVLSLVVFVIT